MLIKQLLYPRTIGTTDVLEDADFEENVAGGRVHRAKDTPEISAKPSSNVIEVTTSNHHQP
jgi:hypothetical protein